MSASTRMIAMVKTAYEKIGAKPIQGRFCANGDGKGSAWHPYCGGTFCCCGGLALALARAPEIHPHSTDVFSAMGLVQRVFKKDDTRWGFLDGFDNEEDRNSRLRRNLKNPHAYRVWWKIGRECAIALGLT